MGADLLTFMLPRRADAPIADNSVDARELAHSAATAWLSAAVDAQQTEVAFDELDMRAPVDYLAPYDTFDEAEAAEGPMVAARFEQAVQEIALEAITAYRTFEREWNHYAMPNGIIVSITGGMSWGDSPSDAYDAFHVLLTCDLGDALFSTLGFVEFDALAPRP